jgi:hypothetical protein
MPIQSAEEFVKKWLGFTFIDDVEPQTRCIRATYDLVINIQSRDEQIREDERRLLTQDISHHVKGCSCIGCQNAFLIKQSH